MGPACCSPVPPLRARYASFRACTGRSSQLGRHHTGSVQTPPIRPGHSPAQLNWSIRGLTSRRIVASRCRTTEFGQTFQRGRLSRACRCPPSWVRCSVRCPPSWFRDPPAPCSVRSLPGWVRFPPYSVRCPPCSVRSLPHGDGELCTCTCGRVL